MPDDQKHECSDVILQFSCVDGGTHPITGKVWYRFPSCVAPGGERYDHYLCSALFMTMHSPDDCLEALAQLDLVRSGQSTETTFGLNDTGVTFTQRGAQVDISIEDEIGHPDGLFGVAEFRKAIVAWGHFLSEPCSHGHALDIDIS